MGLGKTNAGGGAGGSGGILTVNSAGAGTVTVANNILGKTYKKAVKAGGTVVFKGLATGTWTVTVSDGEQSATQTVEIDADYEIAVAYFSATITVTYPANSTCTCSDGSTTLTDINNTTAEKTVTFTVPNTGTWTISATDGDKENSATVKITADGQSKRVTLVYELVIFDNGKLNSIAGGYSGMTISSGYLCISVTDSDGYVDIKTGYLDNTIDVTDFDTLTIITDSASVTDYGQARIALATDTTANGTEGKVTGQVANVNVPEGEFATVTIDVSKISGSYYIVFLIGARHGTSYIDTKSIVLT